MLFVIFSFATDSLLLRLDSHNQRTAIYNVLSAFTIVEYTIFAWLLYLHLDKKVFKKIIIASSIAFYIFTITQYIIGMGIDDKSFDSLSASIEAILIVMFSIFYFFDQMNKPQIFFIYQEPSFWFVVGFIIYFSGTLFLFIQASNLDREIRENFWKINYFLNITKNILFAIAFSTPKNNNLQYPSDDHFEHDILENPYKT